MTNEEHNKTFELSIILANEFEKMWSLLNQAIVNTPEDLWSKKETEWSVSSTIYHIIETADFYRRNSPKNMVWGKKAGINWEGDHPDTIKNKELLITKDLLLSYQKEIQIVLGSILSSSSEYFLHKDDFTWFDTRYEKLFYLLRHCMFHIGELNKFLRDMKCQRIKWS